MLIVLLVLATGIGIGWLLRKSSGIDKWFNYGILFLIFLLLFVLGLEVGSNQKLLTNIGHLGWTALLISLTSILFSSFLAWLVYLFFFKQKS